MSKYGKARYGTRFGRMTVGISTAWTEEEVVSAVKQINARTARNNFVDKNATEYARQKARVTLPPDITAWLKKEV
jgi:hypothetical protein